MSKYLWILCWLPKPESFTRCSIESNRRLNSAAKLKTLCCSNRKILCVYFWSCQWNCSHYKTHGIVVSKQQSSIAITKNKNSKRKRIMAFFQQTRRAYVEVERRRQMFYINHTHTNHIPKMRRDRRVRLFSSQFRNDMVALSGTALWVRVANERHRQANKIVKLRICQATAVWLWKESIESYDDDVDINLD